MALYIKAVNNNSNAGYDSEAFWLGPYMAITVSMQPESGCTLYARSDFLHPVRFHFSKEGPGGKKIKKSNLDGLVRF